MNPGAAQRKLTRVAVGVLERDDGFVLLADRPVGKPYAGYWEFPGGKIEPGEPVSAALQRELHEELGVEVGPSFPWVTFEFDYPHAYVQLHFRRIRHWRGEPHPREGQRLQFVDPSRDPPQPLLPAAVPALRWLRLPATALVVSAGSPVPALAAGIDDSPSAEAALGLVILDADWRNENHAAVVEAWRTAVSGTGLLLASGAGAQAASGVDGVVFESLETLERGATTTAYWRAAWVESADEAQQAAHLRCDFVLAKTALAQASTLDSAAALPVFHRDAGAPSAIARADRYAGSLWIDRRAAPA